LHDTLVNPADFCRQLALVLGLQPEWSRAMTFRLIQQEIERLVQERHLTVLLIVDEAHNLRPDVLALVPLLANFDWDATGRLAILLAGQAGLRQILRLSHLEALAQRITIRFALRWGWRPTSRVDPRGPGETARRDRTARTRGGRSPRARGNPGIPAGAGKPGTAASRRASRTVDPRGRGKTTPCRRAFLS
jgi:hypothetical protein